MAEIVWTDPALSEIEAIAEYIALDNPEAANRTVDRIFSSGEKLARFPKSGARLPEYPKSTYRHLIVDPCRILYRLEGDKVFIVFVLRGGRLLRREFLT